MMKFGKLLPMMWMIGALAPSLFAQQVTTGDRVLLAGCGADRAGGEGYGEAAAERADHLASPATCMSRPRLTPHKTPWITTSIC
jgi:hypothetical protein